MIPFRSHEQALKLGFRYRGHVPCPVCGSSIGIYQQPDCYPLFVDTETFWPHVLAVHNEVKPMPAPPAPPIDRKSAAAGEHDE